MKIFLPHAIKLSAFLPYLHVPFIFQKKKRKKKLLKIRIPNWLLSSAQLKDLVRTLRPIHLWEDILSESESPHLRKSRISSFQWLFFFGKTFFPLFDRYFIHLLFIANQKEKERIWDVSSTLKLLLLRAKTREGKAERDAGKLEVNWGRDHAGFGPNLTGRPVRFGFGFWFKKVP